ncbi:hypothetical protein SLS62_009955 [Diatrype stigma]|uniref:Uncharacterized protein n=1 Tax=Diatrype stigma TaxID=117547 RepID=A0AAN9UC13_9PEZI
MFQFGNSCPWDGRVFGRIWQMFHANQLVSFACIYLVLAQMGITGDIGQRIMGMKKALRFLSCYAAKWPRFMQTSDIWLTSNWLQLQFHLRVLSVEKLHAGVEDDGISQGGLRPSRVTGKLSSLDGMDDVDVIEQRFSIALVTSYEMDLPIYTILYLTDSKYRRLFVESDRPLDMPYHGQFTAVAVYIKVLRLILPLWEQKWTQTLNEVDNLVGVKIDELFNPKGDGAAMMFDSSFARTRLYFTVLQALRIFSEWIQESERALQQLRSNFDKVVHSATKQRNSRDEWGFDGVPPPFKREIDEMWNGLLAYHSSSAKCLLGRIEKKNEEIKSFRDGLFNATSVREASRATVLNQYILVFTFVTIFYLPLSYASSLFSMDVFSYEDAPRGQASFLISTAMIAVVTWIASGIVLWVVHDDERVRNLQAYIGDFRKGVTTLYHKADGRSKREQAFSFQGV